MKNNNGDNDDNDDDDGDDNNNDGEEEQCHHKKVMLIEAYNLIGGHRTPASSCLAKSSLMYCLFAGGAVGTTHFLPFTVNVHCMSCYYQQKTQVQNDGKLRGDKMNNIDKR